MISFFTSRRHPVPKSPAWMRTVTVLLILAAGAAAVFLLNVRRRDDSLDLIRKSGVIRIGYAVEPPYAFIRGDGTVTGLDPEVARRIARRLDIPRVEWRLTEFRELLDGLEAKHFDVIAAGMFITENRLKRVAFSRPTFKVRPALLVQAGNPHKLHSYGDIIRDGAARIAVLSGSVEERLLLQLGIPAARLVHVPDALSGQILVDTAQADGLALSEPTLRWVVSEKRTTRAEMASPFVESPNQSAQAAKFGAFAFRRNDVSLRNAWDRELGAFTRNEEHLRLAVQFGFSEENFPAGMENNPQIPGR